MSVYHRQTKGQDSSSVHYAQVDEWGSWPSLATFQPLNPITTFVHLFSPPPSWSGVDRKRSSEDPGWQDRVVDALFAAASSWVEFVLLAAASELCRRLLRSHSRQSSESRLTTMLWGWIGRCDAFSLRRTFFVDPRILSLSLSFFQARLCRSLPPSHPRWCAYFSSHYRSTRRRTSRFVVYWIYWIYGIQVQDSIPPFLTTFLCFSSAFRLYSVNIGMESRWPSLLSLCETQSRIWFRDHHWSP